MDKFINEYKWAALIVIMIVEFLIGASKLKSNSTIELGVNIIKFIFGLENEPKKLK